jgi:uncharacterized protein (UPF0335 family)
MQSEPHVPASAVRAAAGTVAKQAAGMKIQTDNRQVEAFSDRQTGAADAHGLARDQLRAFVERIERLEEEKKEIADDIKDIYGEAKSMGYDTKVLRKVISIRKQDKDERMEQEAILDTYLHALGMIADPSEE